MPAKKKKFIDKKKAVSFHLVHRSQKDPLQADDEAPQHVLLAVSEKEKKEATKEQEQKFGVFFEDDYDYLQHLKETNEINDVGPGTEVYRLEAKEKKKAEPTIKLSSQLFASDMETDVGLLNKAAPRSGPQLDWDPEIVAALDDDFDFENPENALGDDFISMANADMLPEGLLAEDNPPRFHPDFMGKEAYRPQVKELADSDDDDEKDFASDEAEDDLSDAGSFGENPFEDEETKSRFTSYSMTSSVIRRNEGLTLLDDRFEKLYEQYDDDEIGALDQEEIGGCISSASKVLNSVMEEFEEKTKVTLLKDAVQKAEGVIVASDSDSESSDDQLVKLNVDSHKDQWDCETIISTYSTIYNHPKTISEPRKIREKKNEDVTPPAEAQRGLTLQEIEDFNKEEVVKANTIRLKGESGEEKLARKKGVKLERKQRREDKKQNKQAFKTEEMRQKKELLNLRNNLQGMMIS